MNTRLRKRLSGIETAGHPGLQMTFCLACIERVCHLFTAPDVIEVYEQATRALAPASSVAAFEDLARRASALARSHPGSGGIDGAGNAAVSATHALAWALRGSMVEAAEYAAYAKVYSYASYSVTDPAAFRDEYDWQVAQLEALLVRSSGSP